MANVRWSVFRPGDSGGLSHDYGSDRRRIENAVGDGGTLWLVTSRRTAGAPRTYHLAYKLVGCRPIDPAGSAFSGRYRYVVRASKGAKHFGLNDATELIRDLEFTTGRSMAEVSNVGMRLASVPNLTESDIELLESFEHRLDMGRSVFLSYARVDEPLVAALENALADRGIACTRDLVFLRAGDDWTAALERQVKSADSFVVVVTAASAQSEWVRREVAWAVSRYGRVVQRIIPLVIDDAGREGFAELGRFQAFSFDREPDASLLDALATQLRR
jgi:hypothetical protein